MNPPTMSFLNMFVYIIHFHCGFEPRSVNSKTPYTVHSSLQFFSFESTLLRSMAETFDWRQQAIFHEAGVHSVPQDKMQF